MAVELSKKCAMSEEEKGFRHLFSITLTLSLTPIPTTPLFKQWKESGLHNKLISQASEEETRASRFQCVVESCWTLKNIYQKLHQHLTFFPKDNQFAPSACCCCRLLCFVRTWVTDMREAPLRRFFFFSFFSELGQKTSQLWQACQWFRVNNVAV